MRMRGQGVTIKNIAIYFDISQSTVKRIIRAKRKGRAT